MLPDRGDVGLHEFDATDRVFLDANVWIAMLGPTIAWLSSEGQAEPTHDVHTAAWRRMRDAGTQVFIDTIVLGEVANVWLRRAHKLDDRSVSFKRWRSSDDGRAAADEIASILGGLLPDCSWCRRPLKKTDLAAAFAALPGGRQDLNDLLIVRLCELNDLTLITDDADFSAVQVPILTANRRLLR